MPRGIGFVKQHFGENPANYRRFGLAGHNGLDYPCPVGSHVLSMIDGIVWKVADQGADGYGRYVTVRNGIFETTYAHLSEVSVKVGDQIDMGDMVGLSGNTGNSTGPHLHITVKVMGMRNPAYLGAIDPEPLRDI